MSEERPWEIRPGLKIYLVSALILLESCYTTKAAITPYKYAPATSSTVWTPPASVKAMALNDAPPPLPEPDNPYSLAELVDIALSNNTATKITWAKARSAAAQYGQSQRELFPQLDLDFNYERVRSPAFATSVTAGSSLAALSLFSVGVLNTQSVQPQYYSDWGPELRLSYLIFDFGAVRSTTESYRQALYNADWNHNSAIQRLLKVVMDDYYAYIYQKQLFIANQEDVETAQLVLRSAQTGFEMGVRDVSDVLQAKTSLLQNQTTLATQQQNLTVSRATLLKDMGLPATTPLKTQDLPDTIPHGPILPKTEELLAVALQNRPDLLASEATVKSTEYQVSAAKRDRFPKLRYTFDIGRTYFSGGLNDGYDFDSVFTLSVPLFSGFYHSNAIKTAKANQKKAEEDLREVQLDVIQEVQVTRSQVDVAFSTYGFARDYLFVAQERFTIALSKYQQGTNTILDLTSAQSTLANARAKYIESLQSWYTSLADLAFATGLISPTSTPLNSIAPIPSERVFSK